MTSIPNSRHPVWEKLVTGQTKHKFTMFAANMALDHATRCYAMDTSSKAALIQEFHDFCEKYEHLVASDLASIA
jgi:hypothetical protein